MLLPDRDVQEFLKGTGHYLGKIDGKFGAASFAAVDSYLARSGVPATGWPLQRKRVAVEQLIFQAAGIEVGAVDGYVGPQTRQAYDDYVIKDREHTRADVSYQPTTWPRQKDVTAFYGPMGKNQVMLPLPYPLVYAYGGQSVTRMSLHEKCAPSAGRVLARVLKVYGSRIAELGLNIWGGSLNVRRMRGGTAWSMHSWGIAIDWDPEHNGFKVPFREARFSAPEYQQWWAAWRDEGWICLGPDRNYDTMHVQAARL